MNINIITGVDQNKVASLNWKEGQGSSLSESNHQVLDNGLILCVDRSPSKIKFFKKKDGVINSICCVAERSPETMVSKMFGEEAILRKVSELVLV